MITQYLPCYSMARCIKYHAASNVRRRLLSQATRFDLGIEEPPSDLVQFTLDALNAGAKLVIYSDAFQVRCTHGKQ